MMRCTRLGIFLAFVLAACGGTQNTPSESQIQVAPRETTAARTATPAPVVQQVDPAVSFERAMRAAQSGRASTARTEFETLLGDETFGGLAAYNLGVLAQSEGALSEATRYYDQALTNDPTLGAALMALIRIELSQNDFDGANLAYQRSLSRSQNHTSIRAAGLLIALHRGNFEAVIREARTILIQDESNIDAHYALSSAYHGLGQTELARLVLGEALRREPDRADLHLLQADIQMEQGSDVAAIQSLRDALNVDPNFVEALNNLGVLLHRARNDREAIRHLESAIQLRPDFAEAYLNLSNAYKGAGQLVEAEQALRRALEVRPSLGQAYFGLGLLYLDTEFPGMTRTERLQAAVDNLNQYRNQMRSAIPRNDPAEEYINEALAALEAERQLEQSGGNSGGFDDDDDDGVGDDDGFDDDEFEDDGFEDDGFEDDGFEDEEWEDEEWE